MKAVSERRSAEARSAKAEGQVKYDWDSRE